VPTYMVLFTFRGETVKGFVRKPTDRSAVVAEAARSAGGRLDAYYWMFGQYDGFALVELPDSRAAAALSISVSSTGAFSHLETHELFSADEVQELARRAGEVRYSPPGETPEYLSHAMP